MRGKRIKKLIEFYPCLKCKQKLFVFYFDRLDNHIFLGDRLDWYRSSKKIHCSDCQEIVFRLSDFPTEDSLYQLLLPFINDYVENKSKSKKLKKIWYRYLKKLIKNRLKEINT